MTDLLLSPPWWLYCAVLAIGLFVWLSGNKRADPRGRKIGVGILALGAIMAVMSFLIETDARKVDRQSKELVQAVVDQNWDRLGSLLTPDAKLSIENAAPLFNSREQVTAGAKIGAQKYGLRGASASVEETKKLDYLISTTVRVYSTGDVDPGQPLPSLWQLDWAKGGDGRWVVSNIHALEIGNVKGSDMNSLIPHVP